MVTSTLFLDKTDTADFTRAALHKSQFKVNLALRWISVPLQQEEEVPSSAHGLLDALLAALIAQEPHYWSDNYIRKCPNSTNVLSLSDYMLQS